MSRFTDSSGLSSDAFSYCYVSAENTAGDTCVAGGLVLGGDCARDCSVLASWAQISGRLPWEIDAEGESRSLDFVNWAHAIVHGDRISETIFAVSGACGYSIPEFASSSEVALFRFDGDASVFEGTSAVRISEFVDLGLIDAADVLLVHDCSNEGPFDFEVDVSGIPNEELVVFAGTPLAPRYHGDFPVPAVSPTGTAILALLLLGAGAVALRR